MANYVLYWYDNKKLKSLSCQFDTPTDATNYVIFLNYGCKTKFNIMEKDKFIAQRINNRL